MSLKAFHILFVIAATLLMLGFGLWSISEYRSDNGTAVDLAMGIGSLVLSLVLVGYGRYVLRKLRKISYL